MQLFGNCLLTKLGLRFSCTRLNHVVCIMLAEAGVQLCKFHRNQAWKRHLAQSADKKVLLKMYVVILCHVFAFIGIINVEEIALDCHRTYCISLTHDLHL